MLTSFRYEEIVDFSLEHCIYVSDSLKRTRSSDVLKTTVEGRTSRFTVR